MLILDQHFSSLLGSHHHYLLPLDTALTPPDYPVVPSTIGLNMCALAPSAFEPGSLATMLGSVIRGL